MVLTGYSMTIFMEKLLRFKKKKRQRTTLLLLNGFPSDSSKTQRDLPHLLALFQLEKTELRAAVLGTISGNYSEMLQT